MMICEGGNEYDFRPVAVRISLTGCEAFTYDFYSFRSRKYARLTSFAVAFALLHLNRRNLFAPKSHVGLALSSVFYLGAAATIVTRFR